MNPTRSLSASLLLGALLLAPAVLAQTNTTLLQIAQTNIGSNGFGTSWRGQDVQLQEDAWLTTIVFQTGSATPNVNEIRLMTAVPAPVTLATVTSFSTTSTEVTAVLPQPFLLAGGTRYTVWFHQNNTPNGTYGCNLWLVDPTWGAYHTNVDPTVAPGPGEPGYFWAYQYGTNVRLLGHDNFEITGSLVPGGTAQLQLQAPPLDLAYILFGLRAAYIPIPGLAGALRLDPAVVSPTFLAGLVDPTGNLIYPLSIPNNALLHGVSIRLQALHDPSFLVGATFSPMEVLQIQ